MIGTRCKAQTKLGEPCSARATPHGSTALEAFRAGYGWKFPGTLAPKALRILHGGSHTGTGGGLNFEGYFDGHDVLFKDSRERLTSSYETAKLLVLGYNCFAQENGKEAIDMDALQRCPGPRVAQHLNEWVMLSQSKHLAAGGKAFEARDKILALLRADNSVPQH